MSLKPKKHPLSPIKHPPSVSLPRENIGDCQNLLKELAKKLRTLDCKEAKRLYDALKTKRKLTRKLCDTLRHTLFIKEILNKKQQNDEECFQLKLDIWNKIRKLLGL
ncbi:MAG: hypothetical protein J7K59_04465 [Candidatus Korarchaeota archaeon]|nr:hypothetical protein [Candidatus Korarchaeota archaeon]